MTISLHGRPFVPIGRRTFDPSTIAWSIGNRAVNMDWDSFEATAPGGYGQFQGRALPMRGRRAPAQQGDHVIGTKPTGDVCYEGRLIADPKYVDDVAYFTAMGPRLKVDEYNERLPYQIRDASQWTDLHSDPATFAASSANYQIAQKGNSLGVTAQSGQAFTLGDKAGYYLWVQNWDIQNVRFTLRKVTSNANFELLVRRSDDSFTAPTTVTNFSMAAGGPADGTTENVNIAASASIAIICWNASSGSTPANNNRFWVDAARVGIITDQDVFTSSEVAQDIGQRVGYETQTTGATNMMPLDWNTSAADLLNYLSDIEDQVWLVMDSSQKNTYGKLYFRDWGHRTWHTSLGDLAEDQGLEIQPIYNRVTTTFENPPGVQQQVRSAPEDFNLVDPLPGRSFDYPDLLQLEDPQPNKNLASAVNGKALAKLIKTRVKGQVVVRYTTKGVPFDIWPGDLLALGGFEPTIPPQRIAAVTYNRDGSVTCSLGIDYNLAALVDKRITRHLKKRNRRRR